MQVFEKKSTNFNFLGEKYGRSELPWTKLAHMVDHDPEVNFKQNQINPANRCADIRLQNQKFVQKREKKFDKFQDSRRKVGQE